MSDNKQTNRNHWLDILRAWFCYGVVSIHFGKSIPCSDWSVPIFMLLAAYYSSFSDFSWLRRRVVRVFIPFAVWGFLGFIARSVVERRIDPWMLVSQILVGAPANSPLWFMSVLMAVTILLFVVLKCCKSWGLLLMGGACIVLQYSGINGMAWRGLPVAAEITMGRIVELMPYAIMGVFLQKKYRSKSLPIFMIGVFVMIIGILLRNLIGDFCFRNYNYGGVVRMMGATGLFMCCTKLDEFVPIRNQAVVSGIVWAASLTAGIYYMHKIVGEVIVRSGFFASGTVWLTIVVFVLCATSVCAIRRVGMGRVVA